MKKLKKSQKDILPINWYWPKDDKDFSLLSDKIVENTTTLDNDKKIAENTEKLINDAKKKLSGKTVIGKLVTTEDFEKLLSPSVEDHTIESTFGAKNGHNKKYNAAMQIALSGRMLALQKAIARAGLPDEFLLENNSLEKSFQSRKNIDESLSKAKRRAGYAGRGRSSWSVLPQNSLDLLDRKQLGILPRIVPSWGGTVDPDNPEKINYSGKGSAVGWNILQAIGNATTFAGLYGADIINHGLSGMLGTNHYGKGVLPINSFKDFAQGNGAIASNVMGASRPTSQYDPNNGYYQTGWEGSAYANAPTAQVQNYYDDIDPANNVYTPGSRIKSKIRAMKNHENEFDKYQASYAQHLGSLIDRARSTYGNEMKNHDQGYTSVWDDMTNNLQEKRKQWEASNGISWNMHTLYNWDKQDTMEQSYKQQLIDAQITKAKKLWMSTYDPSRRGMTSASGEKMVPANLFLDRNGRRVQSANPRGEFATKLNNNFSESLKSSSVITQDPHWHHAYHNTYGASFIPNPKPIP